jgi:NAD(P)-dependent dehydrogenase (short-subunit alcohol dehydrogenase family)
MLNVDLVAPILLTRAALPALRASGDAMVVNVTSGIARSARRSTPHTPQPRRVSLGLANPCAASSRAKAFMS